jgi:hypothetical protein
MESLLAGIGLGDDDDDDDEDLKPVSREAMLKQMFAKYVHSHLRYFRCQQLIMMLLI